MTPQLKKIFELRAQRVDELSTANLVRYTKSSSSDGAIARAQARIQGSKRDNARHFRTRQKAAAKYDAEKKLADKRQSGFILATKKIKSKA